MERIYNDLTIGYPDSIDCKSVKGLSGQSLSTFTLVHDENVTSLMIFYSWKDEKSGEYHKTDLAFYINGIEVDNFDKAKDIYYDVYDSICAEYAKDPTGTIFMDGLVTKVLQRHSNPRR